MLDDSESCFLSIGEFVSILPRRIKDRTCLILDRRRLDPDKFSVVSCCLKNRISLFLGGLGCRNPELDLFAFGGDLTANLGRFYFRCFEDHLRLVLGVIHLLDLFSGAGCLFPHSGDIGHG